MVSSGCRDALTCAGDEAQLDEKTQEIGAAHLQADQDDEETDAGEDVPSDRYEVVIESTPVEVEWNQFVLDAEGCSDFSDAGLNGGGSYVEYRGAFGALKAPRMGDDECGAGI